VAWADVATAKAKAIAINLIIVSSYVILSRRHSLKVAEGCYALVTYSLRKRVDVALMRFVTPTTPLSLRMICCVTVGRRVDLSREGNVSLLSLHVDRIVTGLPSKEATGPDRQFIIGENPS
jgi:hypothetical protein